MPDHPLLAGDSLHISRFQVGSGDPNGVVTAGIIGEAYFDTTNDALYVAKALTDSDWVNEGSAFNTFLELLDTPSSYSGEGGNVIQVNAGATGLEFGQDLKETSAVIFAGLQTTQFLSSEGITIELNENSNVDAEADQGGIRLRGATEKRIIWVNADKAWTFNQISEFMHEVSIGALSAPATDASLDLKATDKAMVLNRLTETARDALTPIAGMNIYNTTSNQEEFYNGTVWINKGASGGDVVGPVSAFDNEIVRFDSTTGKVIQGGGGSALTTVFVTDTAQIGLGTGAGAITGMIQIDSALNDKQLITLDQTVADGFQFTGFGYENNIFRAQLQNAADDFVVYVATGASDKPIMSVNGTGAFNFGPDLSAGRDVDSDTEAQFTNDTTRSTLKIKGNAGARLNLYDGSAAADLKQANIVCSGGEFRVFQSNDDFTTGANLITMSLSTGDMILDEGQFYHQNKKATTTDSQVATLADEVVEVWQESDYGTAVSSVITLVDGTTYHRMDSFSRASQLLIPTGASVQFTTANRGHVETFTNATLASFKGTDIGTLALFDCVFDGNSTGTLFDIDGGVISAKFPDFNNWDSMGTVTNLTDFFGPGMFWDTSIGLRMTDCSGCTIYGLFAVLSNPGASLFVIDGASSGDLQFEFNILDGGDTNAFFNIFTNYPTTQTVNILGNNKYNATAPFFNSVVDSTDDRVISLANKGAADSTANADIGALDEGGTQTPLSQNIVQRIVGTFSEVSAQRFTTDSAGTVEYTGREDITVSILSTVTGTVSTGTNISFNFYVVKGNSLNTITALADQGGGVIRATTSLDHGYTTGDRIIIEGTASNDGEFTITVFDATNFDFTDTFTGTATGDHSKVQTLTKASNDFSSSANKNTTLIAQLPAVTNDYFFIGVENAGNAGEWDLEDIHELYSKV